jgi:hypothetical protein
MKRIILIVTVLMFIVGLSIPSNLFAGDKSFIKGKAQSKATISKPSVKKDLYREPKPKLVRSLRATIGMLLNEFTRSTVGVVIITLPPAEPDGPVEMSKPPSIRKLEKKNRPDKDDHGWGDTNR